MKKTFLFIALIFLSFNISAQTITANTGIGNWDATSSWSGGVVPSSSNSISIPSGAKVKVNATGLSTQSVSISSGGELEVNNPFTISGESGSSIAGNLSIKANLTVSTGNFSNTGSITVTAGKQFIFSSTSSTLTNNTGNITLNSSSTLFSSLIFGGTYSGGINNLLYARYITGVTTTGASDWNLVGSPVSGEIANDIIAQSNLATNSGQFGIGTYNNASGATGTWSTFDSDGAFAEGSLEPGKGFQMATIGTGATINFTGTPLTANVTFSITEGDSDGDASGVTGTRFNLLANPYPAFISVNSSAATASANGDKYVLSTSNLALLHANNKAVYVFNGTNYTTMNSATSAASAVIAPGEGFIVGGNYSTSGDFTFEIAMRTEDGTADTFSGDAADPDRAELFLTLSNVENSNTTEIYFLEEGTDGLDYSFDSGTLGIANNTIYSRLVSEDEGIDMSIQSLNFTEINDKVIPLGINAESGTEATISISYNTTNPSTYVYLEDAIEGTFTNLKETDFVITPDSDLEGIGRFFIHTSSTTMSNEDTSTNLLNVYKLERNNFITVEGLATQSNTTNLKLYNILGSEVLSTTLANNTNTQTISTEGLSAGIYVIKLESGNNLLTKKLIIK